MVNIKESKSDRITHYSIVVLLSIFSIIMVFPLYYVIIVSFTDAGYFNAVNGKVFLPLYLSLEAYKILFSTKAIFKALGVTVFITVIGTLLSLIMNAGFSYAVSRKRFRARNFIMFAVMITMIFNPGIIPQYLLVRNIGLMNSVWSLILPVLTDGYYIILMRGFFQSIPQSLEEAAVIDGCNDITIWLKIILPLSMPSIAAFGLFYAVGYWNTYLTAIFYINNPELWPVQVIIQNLLDSATATSSMEALKSINRYMPSEMLKMAAVVVGVVPILLVYPFLQKHFTKGIMMGSIKE